MRPSTANMAHQNLFLQKSSTRALCRKRQTSGRVSVEVTTEPMSVLSWHTSLFKIFSLSVQASRSHCLSVVSELCFLWFKSFNQDIKCH